MAKGPKCGDRHATAEAEENRNAAEPRQWTRVKVAFLGRRGDPSMRHREIAHRTGENKRRKQTGKKQPQAN